MSEYISDEDIDAVWGNANFGDRPRRDVVNEALFQVAGGYSTGHTAKCICQELGLVGNKRGAYQSLTKKGKRYLYEVYKGMKKNTRTDNKTTALLKEVRGMLQVASFKEDHARTIEGHLRAIKAIDKHLKEIE